MLSTVHIRHFGQQARRRRRRLGLGILLALLAHIIGGLAYNLMMQLHAWRELWRADPPPPSMAESRSPSLIPDEVPEPIERVPDEMALTLPLENPPEKFTVFLDMPETEDDELAERFARIESLSARASRQPDPIDESWPTESPVFGAVEEDAPRPWDISVLAAPEWAAPASPAQTAEDGSEEMPADSAIGELVAASEPPNPPLDHDYADAADWPPDAETLAEVLTETLAEMLTETADEALADTLADTLAEMPPPPLTDLAALMSDDPASPETMPEAESELAMVSRPPNSLIDLWESFAQADMAMGEAASRDDAYQDSQPQAHSAPLREDLGLVETDPAAPLLVQEPRAAPRAVIDPPDAADSAGSAPPPDLPMPTITRLGAAAESPAGAMGVPLRPAAANVQALMHGEEAVMATLRARYPEYMRACEAKLREAIVTLSITKPASYASGDIILRFAIEADGKVTGIEPLHVPDGMIRERLHSQEILEMASPFGPLNETMRRDPLFQRLGLIVMF